MNIDMNQTSSGFCIRSFQLRTTALASIVSSRVVCIVGSRGTAIMIFPILLVVEGYGDEERGPHSTLKGLVVQLCSEANLRQSLQLLWTRGCLSGIAGAGRVVVVEGGLQEDAELEKLQVLAPLKLREAEAQELAYRIVFGCATRRSSHCNKTRPGRHSCATMYL